VTRLNEVVGGMLRDLVESRVAADALSREHAELYRADVLLSQIPVPRFAIREVSLKLRFAVQEIRTVAPSADDIALIRNAWVREVVEKVVPMSLDVLSVDPAASAALLAKLRAAPSRMLDVAGLAKGTPGRLAAATADWVVSGRAGLADSVRRKLPSNQVLRTTVTAALASALEAFGPRARWLLGDRAALRSELDIEIKRAELDQVPESRIHELTLTFATDDLELANPPGGAASGQG
jgi:hypothetical protein